VAAVAASGAAAAYYVYDRYADLLRAVRILFASGATKDADLPVQMGQAESGQGKLARA